MAIPRIFDRSDKKKKGGAELETMVISRRPTQDARTDYSSKLKLDDFEPFSLVNIVFCVKDKMSTLLMAPVWSTFCFFLSYNRNLLPNHMTCCPIINLNIIQFFDNCCCHAPPKGSRSSCSECSPLPSAWFQCAVPSCHFSWQAMQKAQIICEERAVLTSHPALQSASTSRRSTISWRWWRPS